MDDPFFYFERYIKEASEKFDFIEDKSICDRITVEVPRDSSHGHLATNAAMVLGKGTSSTSKKNPREIAELLVTSLSEHPSIESVTIAGPGFVNMTLVPAFWTELLSKILGCGLSYGGDRTGSGRRVNVEYVSANPTGPLHVGHCRGAVVGDVLASLLSFAGYDVTREYYTNDAGGQIEILARSVYLRYRELFGETIEIPEGFYPGEYLIEAARTLKDEHNDSLLSMDESDWLPITKKSSITSMMNLVRSDLSSLNIHHDVFFSELSLHAVDDNNESLISRTIAGLESRDLVYRGKLARPKGGGDSDWEDREQLLFRATSLGDDTDRALMKSNGDYTYFAADIAYFADKYARNFDEMIFVLGSDHAGYVKRMEAIGRAISGDSRVTIRLCQLVKLLRDGEPAKMSKRSGEFVTLRDVVDEVGSDAVRFMMLYRRNDVPLDFDFARVVEQSKDNPVFYVQYAHARCCSVFRQAEELDLDVSDESLSGANLSRLVDSGELGLVRKLSEYPRIIDLSSRSHEPHRLAFYLHELSSLFHGHWNRGHDDSGLRFINPNDAELSLSRLVLVRCVSLVLSSGLSIMGVSSPEEMR